MAGGGGEKVTEAGRPVGRRLRQSSWRERVLVVSDLGNVDTALTGLGDGPDARWSLWGGTSQV